MVALPLSNRTGLSRATSETSATGASGSIVYDSTMLSAPNTCDAAAMNRSASSWLVNAPSRWSRPSLRIVAVAAPVPPTASTASWSSAPGAAGSIRIAIMSAGSGASVVLGDAESPWAVSAGGSSDRIISRRSSRRVAA